MKKLILLLCFFLSFAVYAANPEKDFKKYINKYDVADEAKTLTDNTPSQFWITALDHNESLVKFAKDMDKGKGAEKEALRRAANLPRFYPEYDNTVMENLQGFCDTLLINMGINELGYKCSLHVVYADELNAFCALTENGFAICLSSGLITQRGMTCEILMGYVAHEFAHGALYHHLRGLYAEAKQRRKNKLLGGIAAGLNVLAAGANAYSAGVAGTTYDNTPYYNALANIDADIKLSTLKYSFKYSREQEFEADLFAYRFLENLGCAEEFINGLRILGTQYDGLYSEYSDHPTVQSRISFLRYVAEHPELGNKENGKLKKKRNKPETEW